ncbi:MAG: FAD:protein FMN transferase [Asticcacaulis sp.]|uniref:FAD:protein FMN transferase n=1 Tax=Asticcacaulis sp. TaxID=1872648 RepID=UPI003F7C0F18
MTAADPTVLIPDLDAPPDLQRTAQRLSFGGAAFATTWRVRLCADPARFAGLDRLRAACAAKLERIDAEMSPYREESDLTRFNRAAAGDVVPLPALTMQVLRGALEIAVLTNGAFDPCLLAAVELWGFGARAVPEGLPDAADIAALPSSGWRALHLTGSGLIKPDGVQLDLCGVAKGFAVDEVLRLCRAEPGVTAALVEIGGELKGWGVQPDGQPWWVGIEHTDARVALCGWAAATSGDGRRAFVHKGRLYSHTLDAETGAPTTSDIASATVFDRDCWRADALATALIVMGEARALSFAAEHDLPCWLRVRDGDAVRTVLSPRLEGWAG